jgi:aspartate carbamoyltransferase catalytic subunit
MYTIRHYKKDFANLTVAIVGDVLHSRVARSDIHALTTLGVPEIRAVGPKTLVPGDLASMGVRVCHTLNNTVAASVRMLIALLENHQNADGTVTLPEVLRPYMGGRERIGRPL